MKSHLNGIPLCKQCHGQFDHAEDPGFVFVPVDLQFFIDFETDNRQKRKLNGGTRSVPTTEQYTQHLVKTRQYERHIEETRGTNDTEELEPTGVYRRAFLKNYLHGNRLTPEQLGLTRSKRWHGAPLASLRRAIHALGSGRIVMALDKETIGKLQVLRDLYFSPLETEQDDELTRRRFPEEEKHRDDDDYEEQHREDRDRKEEWPRKKLKLTFQGASAENDRRREACFGDIWVLGPNSTSASAAERFSPAFARG